MAQARSFRAVVLAAWCAPAASVGALVAGSLGAAAAVAQEPEAGAPGIPTAPPEWSMAAGSVEAGWQYEAGGTRAGDSYLVFDLVPAGAEAHHVPLTLAYNAGRPASADLPPDGLGDGWRIDFAVTVRWCPAYADSHALRFEPTEDLCMGSAPLVLVSGTHLQPGARYRELLDSFRAVTVRGGPERDAIWFEARERDGTVIEIGRTPDSRLALRAAATAPRGDGAVAARPPYPRSWSINALRVGADRVIRYEYFEDERAGVRVPKRIVDAGLGTEVRFRYGRRQTPVEVPFAGYRQRQWLRLHTIEHWAGGRKTVEYRFDSAGAPERLRRMQTCWFAGSVAPGAGAPGCLPPMTLAWRQFGARTPLARTVVREVVDPGGIRTVFEYGLLSSDGRHDFAFGAEQSPFGAVPPVAGARPLKPTRRGHTKLVVTAMDQTVRAQHQRVEYGYLRPGFDSGNHWGFLGFPASRVAHVTHGIVTYHQYRMDFPHLAEESARVHYDRPYGAQAQPVGRGYKRHATLVFEHGAARTYFPYVAQTTEMQYAHGRETATRQMTDTYLASAATGLQRIERTIERALSAAVAETGALWGDVRYELEHVVDREVVQFDPSAAATGQGPAEAAR